MINIEHIKKLKTKKYRKYWIYSSLIALAIILANCGVYFDDQNYANPFVEAPSVKAGDTMTVVMHTRYESYGDKLGFHLVGGFLAPKSWNAAHHTTMYFTSTITTGVQRMSLIPSSEIAPGSNGQSWPDAVKTKYGIGSNVINDLEWVVFWSDNTFDIHNQQFPTADITIKVKTGTENLQYKRGYFLSESVDGFSVADNDPTSLYARAAFTSCFQITDGEGDLVDFCNPQIGAAEPSKAKVDDIVSFKYDGELDTTNLKNEGDIFFCAKAYTSDGQTIDACSQEDKSKMVPWGFHKWRIDLWPRKYFNLQSGQSLTKIEYYFMDKTGTIKTGYGNTTAPFVYTFKCE
jgi:hypothetical protein